MRTTTGRERVLTAVSYREPDRVPFAWGFGPTPEMERDMEAYLATVGLSWARLRDAASDIYLYKPDYIGPELSPGKDIWGIHRNAVKFGAGEYDEIDYYPLAGIESACEIDDYDWPDPRIYDYGSLREHILHRDPARLRAVRVLGGNPFEIYCWMTGLEESMVNLLIKPEIVVRALDHITKFYVERLNCLLDCCGDLVDLVFLADDLGTQRGLLMSRECYRQILQPFHLRQSTAVHTLAPHARTLFHSDGAVFDILPDLVDSGMDILEAVQTDAEGMDPAKLKGSYGSVMCFHGGISVQSLLPHGDEDTVSRECRRLVETFGKGGGYIAAPSHALQVGTPPQNVLAMLRVVLGEEDYEQAVDRARLE